METFHSSIKCFNNNNKRIKINWLIFLILIISNNVITSISSSSSSSSLSSTYSDTVYFNVKENSPPQTYVGQIQIKQGFHYHINDDCPIEFYFDKSTGIIVTTNVPLDREIKSQYSFVILSSSPTYPIQVKIRIIDVNDNIPIWPDYINTNLTFSESAPIGTRIILDNPIDPDEGDLQFTLNLINNDVDNDDDDSDNDNDDNSKTNFIVNELIPFQLNYNTTTKFLSLEISSKLDREFRSNYQLNITVNDNGDNIQHFSSIIYNLIILDSNDNPPIFDHSDYLISVNDSIGKDVSILQVQATDADQEQNDNSRISYYLQKSVLNDFKIDANTGIISTVHDGPFHCGHHHYHHQQQQQQTQLQSNSIKSLNNNQDDDDDGGRICVFTVFAHDHGQPRQDGRTYVTARIRPTNNHAPIMKFRYFSKSQYANVDENAINGSVVAAISVIDFDHGQNGLTWLEIVNGNERGHFRLESLANSHIIKVNSTLDRERIAQYNLTIMAHDYGEPSKHSTDNLIIIVQDHNDHGPKFDKDLYEVTIVESQHQIGMFVIALHATDQDVGINAEISYSISGPDSHYFHCDSITGLITTAKIIDREQIDSFELRVTARDGASNPKWAYTILRIKVLDQNDCRPQIRLPNGYYFNENNDRYEIDLNENIILDLDLIIDDQDLGSNGTVDVQLLYDYNGLFFITKSFNKLKSSIQFDYEQCNQQQQQYRLVLMAKDHGPNALWSLTTILITIRNVDDESPKLYQKQYYSFIPINALTVINYSSIVINKLQIRDNDFQIPIKFDIQDDKYRQYFHINNNGEMHFKNNVNIRWLQNQQYRHYFHFDINCIGCAVGYNSTRMNIFLIDTNNNSYQFTNNNNNQQQRHQSYRFEIYENKPIDTIVGELSNNVIIDESYQFYIIKGDPNQCFHLDRNDNLLILKTNKILDREENDHYKLQIIAIRLNHFYYIDIDIDILDVNDCQPYFRQAFDIIEIDEKVPVMYNVYNLNAIDLDQSSSIRYELIENISSSSSINNIFYIDNDDNSLKLAMSINNDNIIDDLIMINNDKSRSTISPLIQVIIKAIDKNNQIDNKLNTTITKQYGAIYYNDNDSTMSIIRLFIVIKPVLLQSTRKPRFMRKFVELFLIESIPVNEKFYEINIDDNNNRQIDTFFYKINDSNIDDFTILPDGHLYVRRPLDREKCDLYMFNIDLVNAISNDLIVDTMQMLIHIKDVNDNKPIFEKESYHFQVPENVSKNFYIGRVHCTDKDLGTNAQIMYSIVNSYYSSYVKIDSNTGHLWTNYNYDREQLSNFEIMIQAVDQPLDEEYFIAQTLVHIEIIDINDNRPQFEIPINVTITNRNYDNDDGNDDDNMIMYGEMNIVENIAIGTVLTRFEAIDLDADSIITYQLKQNQSNNNNLIFSLNQTTGLLTLTNELDRESCDRYSLIIEASDGRYKSEFHLKIIIDDFNDCLPEWLNFNDNIIDLYVNENISIGSEIFEFEAIDRDVGQNALFHFSIDNHSGMLQKYFDILSKKLIVINRLDYEKNRQHLLNISLIETTLNRVATTKTIRINVQDINDCSPTFVRRMETEVIRISENLDIGSKLLSLQAYDCDQNDSLKFEIITCNTHYHTHRNLYRDQEEDHRNHNNNNDDNDNNNINHEHQTQYKHDSNNCPLKLNPITGEIININNLDREVIESINLHLLVRDNVGHMDRMKIIFIIDDVNDESPMFITPNSIVIEDLQYKRPNAIVGSVKAIDLDIGINSVITYKLEQSPSSSNQIFDLDPFTGIFRLKTSINTIFNEPIIVNVSATDGGGLKTFDQIEFITIDSNRLWLDSIDIQLEINENLPLSTEIYRLQCQNNDDNDDCHFYLINATDRNFEVNRQTGIITVIDLIDREMLDHRSLQTLVMIGSKYLQRQYININILDQNDNPPYLTNQSIIIELSETLPIGSIIFDISRMIADEDLNNKFDYQIINCSSCTTSNGVFTLNRKTGIFTLQSPLDCEKIDKYRIIFGVSDGIYLLTSLIDIHIIDENDNQPYFSQSNYVFNIDENTERGTIVGQIHAFDADVSNKNLIYSIINDDDDNDDQSIQMLASSIFSLDSRSGQFTLTKKLDYEKDLNQYQLKVIVSDGKYRSKPVNVLFKLINLSDNVPIFESSIYRLEIVENIIANNVICLKAFDADLINYKMNDENLNIINITYYLIDNNNNNRQNIQIDQQTGCISIIRPLDREIQSSINVTIIASDHYSNATATLLIRILDENDNYPVFDGKTSRTIRIMENTPVDTVVYTFKAIDLDAPPNSYVQYELITNTIDHDNRTLPFIIGPIDGQLKITGLIDREQCDHYDLIIRATDYGGRYTDHHCRIDVDDVNDNSPTFRQHLYELRVYENITIGQTILKLDAIDADPSDEINYKIISGDPYGIFQIDDDQIIIAVDLSYEENNEFNLKINAIDRDGNIDTANIHIIIMNVLNEKPIFTQSIYEVNWYENHTGIIGQFIAKVSKLHEKKRSHLQRSSSSLNRMNYLLLNNFNDSFRLNSSNAMLSIIRSIDLELLQQEQKSNQIDLKIMAIDSLSRLSSVAKISINIMDINDNVPKFVDQKSIFRLKENQQYATNTSIGQILVEDADQDDIIVYRLNTTYNDKFIIDNNGILRLQSSIMFDREQYSQYPMQIIVSDSKHLITTNITIIIDDENDCAPKITRINGVSVVLNTNHLLKINMPTQILRSIFKNNFALIGIEIFDCDDGINGHVQLRIDDENLYNVFNVDDQNGIIKTDGRNLNEEMLMQSIEQIDLIISDQSDINQLSTEYTIEFEWTNDDDTITMMVEKELVGKYFIELFISETMILNECLYTFEIDNNNNSNVTIEIYAGDLYNTFDILNNSLINIRSLDYETIKSYDLYLKATNNQNSFQLIFIRINIVNENDNAPVFIQSVYNVTIPEEESNLFVQQVWANDLDSPDTQIKYSIIDDDNGLLPFKINSNTGNIFTTNKIDREIDDHFRLTIMASDNDGLYSTCIVYVNIEDKNDNPPRFTHLLRTNISESTPIDSFIIQVQCIDKDLGNNSLITYSLLTETQAFRIDSNDGKIYLTQPLDRESKEQYFLIVSANDGSWKSQTTVTIYVLDENDCHPQFKQKQYEFQLYNNNDYLTTTTINKSIGKVEAIDIDQYDNGIIKYRLKERSKYFYIDSKTGEIFLRQMPKFYEKEMSFLNYHSFTVIAMDSGRRPNTAEANILIQLKTLDEDDKNNKDYVKLIPINLKNGTILYTSNTMIQLINDNNIDNDNDRSMKIYQTHLNQLLFYGESIVEIGDIFSLNIDNNYETFTLNITIISSNQYEPIFTNTLFNDSITITERIIENNQLVYRFEANDDDNSDSLNGQIYYTFNISKLYWNPNIDNYLAIDYKESYGNLFKKNLSSYEMIDYIDEFYGIKMPFKLNETTGELRIEHSIDYEIITGYLLIVTVNDRAWYSKQSSIVFNVWINDIDDFVGYNLIDSDKLYHDASMPKPDPMSIGVMVVVFFFVILILVISTSFLVYHNQRKRLLSETRKISTTNSTLRPFDIHSQFSNEMAQRLQQQEIINNIALAVNQQRSQHILLNSNLSQSTSQPQPASVIIQQQKQQQQQCNSGRNSIRKTVATNQQRLPQSIQPSIGSLSSTSRLPSSNHLVMSTTKPDIVVPPPPQPPSVINMDPNVHHHVLNSIPPTVASSIYTHSNSENYTDNYSNILAGAEHYDLENASSIAPSDIDIVYHYKGFRNRDRIINGTSSLHPHGNGSQTSKGHNNHAPLSRLSPSVSELSSTAHPHILTLQDLRDSQQNNNTGTIMHHHHHHRMPPSLPPPPPTTTTTHSSSNNHNNNNKSIDDEMENNSYGAYSVYTGVGGDDSTNGW